MTLAYGTAINVPGGTLPIEQIDKGDVVLAGSLLTPGMVAEWMPRTVTVSSGIPVSRDPNMVFLQFQGKQQSMTCTPEQPVLLADGTIVGAAQLNPGDQLVSAEGTPVTIVLAAQGSFFGGVQAIGVGEWTGSPNGHFIAANGIVVGDYFVQVYMTEIDASKKTSS